MPICTINIRLADFKNHRHLTCRSHAHPCLIKFAPTPIIFSHVIPFLLKIFLKPVTCD